MYRGMVICNDLDDADQYASTWGNTTFELSKEEILALLEGKVLADPYPNEYGTFIKMEEDND